jgi:hypothetical protein
MKYIKDDAEKELNKDFVEALEQVLSIRAERKLIYGDSFLNETPENILSIIAGKEGRLRVLLANNPTHPKVLDEIKDIINYYLFLSVIFNKRGEITHANNLQ